MTRARARPPVISERIGEQMSGKRRRMCPAARVDDHSHDRHLRKFRPSFTDARDQEGDPDQTEQEPGAQNDDAIRETSLDDF